MSDKAQAIFIRLLKNLGIWEFVWQRFCEEYPIRMSAKTPEAQSFMKENDKAFTDMIIHGMGAVKHVPYEEIRND